MVLNGWKRRGVYDDKLLAGWCFTRCRTGFKLFADGGDQRCGLEGVHLWSKLSRFSGRLGSFIDVCRREERMGCALPWTGQTMLIA